MKAGEIIENVILMVLKRMKRRNISVEQMIFDLEKWVRDFKKQPCKKGIFQALSNSHKF